MKRFSRTFSAIAASVALVSHAADVQDADYSEMLAKAKANFYAPVVINFAGNPSPDQEQLLKLPEHVTSSRVSQINSVLGANALQTGQWSNNFGQLAIYVNAAGIEALRKNELAKTIHPDRTRSLREVAYIRPEHRTKIESALQNGAAEVEISLNSESAYLIQGDGRTILESTGNLSGVNTRQMAAIQDAANKEGVLKFIEDASARAGASATFTAKIDRIAYWALLEHPEVRSIKLPGNPAPNPKMDVAALEALKTQGSLEVFITLKGGDTYSPRSGYMSDKAWQTQSQSHRQVFNEILRKIGTVPDNLKLFDGIGVAHAHLSHSALQRLYSLRDPRIWDISLVSGVGLPSLTKAMPTIAMDKAWAAGYRAAGQKVVIMDTGILKNHVFFRNQAGNTRVTLEGCFSSSGSLKVQEATPSSPAVFHNFVNVCPSPNSDGDSPVGLVGSGEPYGGDSHGTHVAGIAAGRKNPSLPNPDTQGTAPDAEIVSVQIYSWNTSTNRLENRKPDLLTALDTLLANTIEGINNPLTVNISVAADRFFSSCTAGDHGPIQLAVSKLVSRGVPVVAAAGNLSGNTAFAFPACLPGVVKVSSVLNDGIGNTRNTSTLIGDPVLFNNDPVFLAPGGTLGQGKGVSSSLADSTTTMGPKNGTSMAAPQVTGLFAAIKAADPTATVSGAALWISTAGSVPITISVIDHYTGTSRPVAFPRLRTPF